MNVIEIGRLLRAGATGCVVGCRASQVNVPRFGGMVRIPLDDRVQTYGLILDIQIADDGLVRQLVSVEGLDEEIIQDNRLNRNVPLEISVLFIGYQQDDQIYHLLPPRPPLTLDLIYACSDAEVCQFTNLGRFGYFRHILRAADLPVGDLLAAHLKQTDEVQTKAGDAQWIQRAAQELIILLRDDYPTLMSLLGALSDTRLDFNQ